MLHQWCHINKDQMRVLEMRVQDVIDISSDLYHITEISLELIPSTSLKK